VLESLRTLIDLLKKILLQKFEHKALPRPLSFKTEEGHFFKFFVAFLKFFL
jgi:hypothetical protein